MANALASKLDRLEAELSPKPKINVTYTLARSDEEFAALRKLHENVIAQGEMHIVTWLPAQE